jgi:hypothetical protein
MLVVVAIAGLCTLAAAVKNPLLLYRIIHSSTGDSSVCLVSSMPETPPCIRSSSIGAGDPSLHSCYRTGETSRVLVVMLMPESPPFNCLLLLSHRRHLRVVDCVVVVHRWIPTECSLCLVVARDSSVRSIVSFRRVLRSIEFTCSLPLRSRTW